MAGDGRDLRGALRAVRGTAFRSGWSFGRAASARRPSYAGRGHARRGNHRARHGLQRGRTVRGQSRRGRHRARAADGRRVQPVAAQSDLRAGTRLQGRRRAVPQDLDLRARLDAGQRRARAALQRAGLPALPPQGRARPPARRGERDQPRRARRHSGTRRRAPPRRCPRPAARRVRAVAGPGLRAPDLGLLAARPSRRRRRSPRSGPRRPSRSRAARWCRCAGRIGRSTASATARSTRPPGSARASRRR